MRPSPPGDIFGLCVLGVLGVAVLVIVHALAR